MVDHDWLQTCCQISGTLEMILQVFPYARQGRYELSVML